MKVLAWIVAPAIALLLGVLGGVGLASIINMPQVESLANFTPGVITRLFDRNGEVFATYAKEKRVLIEEGEVPQLLQNAILAAEDSNFFQHGGIDAEGVLRAMSQNLRQGRLAMGGSTITMQLARQLYLTPKKTWQRKAEEALLAVELEKNFSKQQILTLYCNLIFMGHGNYGMESASRAYFGKTTKDVDLAEAAVLAGIPQRPSAYSPYKNPELVVTRRDYVLRRMREEGYITEEEYQETISLPLLVVPNRQKDLRAPYFAEEVRRYLESTYGAEGLLEQGLQVDTTLDPRIQSAAEAALEEGLVRLDHRHGWRGALHHVEAEEMEGYELPSWRDVELIAGKWYEALVLSVGSHGAEVRIGEAILELHPDGMKWTRRQDPRQILEQGDVVWVSLEAADDEEGSSARSCIWSRSPSWKERRSSSSPPPGRSGPWSAAGTSTAAASIAPHRPGVRSARPSSPSFSALRSRPDSPLRTRSSMPRQFSRAPTTFPATPRATSTASTTGLRRYDERSRNP